MLPFYCVCITNRLCFVLYLLQNQVNEVCNAGCRDSRDHTSFNNCVMEESSEGNNNKHHHHYDDNENNDDSDDEEEEGEEGENNSGNSGFFNTYELEVPISVTSSSNSSSAINFVLGETSSMVTGVHEHRVSVRVVE